MSFECYKKSDKWALLGERYNNSYYTVAISKSLSEANPISAQISKKPLTIAKTYEK